MRSYLYAGGLFLLLALIGLTCGGCAMAYSHGKRPDASEWSLWYVSTFWSKDFTDIDAANGRAGKMVSQPDGEEIAGAVAGAAVKAVLP